MPKTMRDKMAKLSEEKYLPKTVKNMEEELIDILPPGEEGSIFVSIQCGGSSLTLPLPGNVKQVLDKFKIKNRTIFEIKAFKIAVDII